MVYLGKEEHTVLKSLLLAIYCNFFPLDNAANQKAAHIFHTGGFTH